MLVKILRFDPARDSSPAIQDYEVPVPTGEGWTIEDLLDFIAERLDPSLAYYRHSLCRQGICGRCAVRANGVAVLACSHPAEGEELLLEPAGVRVVRDLVRAEH
jgi:succinate dehydrogenase/fumarate reductase-like Fe-S protein